MQIMVWTEKNITGIIFYYIVDAQGEGRYMLRIIWSNMSVLLKIAMVILSGQNGCCLSWDDGMSFSSPVGLAG